MTATETGRDSVNGHQDDERDWFFDCLSSWAAAELTQLRSNSDASVEPTPADPAIESTMPSDPASSAVEYGPNRSTLDWMLQLLDNDGDPAPLTERRAAEPMTVEETAPPLVASEQEVLVPADETESQLLMRLLDPETDSQIARAGMEGSSSSARLPDAPQVRPCLTGVSFEHCLRPHHGAAEETIQDACFDQISRLGQHASNA